MKDPSYKIGMHTANLESVSTNIAYESYKDTNLGNSH
jgi:hypothetical protein